MFGRRFVLHLEEECETSKDQYQEGNIEGERCLLDKVIPALEE
jgi:hypothetical protein